MRSSSSHLKKKFKNYILMKTTFAFSLMLMLFLSSITNSQTPTYSLTARNLVTQAPDSLTFDVYLFHTNASTVPEFQYCLGQYFFNFNTNIANGGSLTYRIVNSDLPENLRPRNPSIAGNLLRLATNATPGPGNGFQISSTGNGTLVVRMSLTTTASSFALNEPLNLTWVNPPQSGLVTKIFAYINNINTEVTTPLTHNVVISVNQISTAVPERYDMFQNYPNPFNPSTKIRFDLPAASDVTLAVYDISGKLVSEMYRGKLQAGNYEYKWNAGNLSSGVYFYRIQAGEFTKTMRMMLLK